jgi:hypothetical protein
MAKIGEVGAEDRWGDDGRRRHCELYVLGGEKEGEGQI